MDIRINLWGVSGTLVFAVLVNFLIGISCFMFSYKAKVLDGGRAQKTSGSKKTPQKDETEDGQPSHPSERKSALVIFVVSGFCAMAYEVIWTRTHNNLGIALARKGKIEDAVVHFREALRIKPDYVSARNNLRKALKLQGKR